MAAGCGGEDAPAESRIEAGDALVEEIREDSNRISEAVNDLSTSTLQGDIQSSAEYAQRVSEIEFMIDGLEEPAEQARAEYQEVLDLDAPEVFSRYARLRLQWLDKLQQYSQKTVERLEILAAAAAAEEEGKQVDVQELTASLQSNIEEIDSIETELDEINRQIDEAVREMEYR